MRFSISPRLMHDRSGFLAALLVLASLLGCHSQSPTVTADASPPEVQLPTPDVELTLVDLDNRPLWPDGNSPAKAIALIFILPDCPICNAYIPELNRLHEDLASKSVKLVLVHADTTVTVTEATKHAHEYQIKAPVALDPTRAWIKKAEATIAPEAAVFSPKLELLYRGRINNQYAGLGQRRTNVTSHDLRDACDAILADQPVKEPRTEAFGCLIPHD